MSEEKCSDFSGECFATTTTTDITIVIEPEEDYTRRKEYPFFTIVKDYCLCQCEAIETDLDAADELLEMMENFQQQLTDMALYVKQQMIKSRDIVDKITHEEI